MIFYNVVVLLCIAYCLDFVWLSMFSLNSMCFCRFDYVCLWWSSVMLHYFYILFCVLFWLCLAFYVFPRFVCSSQIWLWFSVISVMLYYFYLCFPCMVLILFGCLCFFCFDFSKTLIIVDEWFPVMLFFCVLCVLSWFFRC